MSDTVSRTIAALQAAGFRGDRLKTAFGIVMRESGGNPHAHNPNRATGDDSYGLAQINMLGSLGPARRKQFGIQSNDQLYDPKVNARAMYVMSHGGKDFGAWGIGPNAYRQGAGQDTIQRFVDQFPGAPTHAGGTGPVARVPSSPQPPAPPSPQPDQRRAYGLALLASLIAKRHGSDIQDRRMAPTVGPNFPVYEDGSGNTPFESFLLTRIQQLAAEPQPARPPVVFPAKTPLGSLQRNMGVKPAQLRLPIHYQPTHVTDGLGWGTKTARDFMAPPGTTVGSPVNGRVVYFHPTGAQGGGSMLIDSLNGKRQVWLGHIAKGLRPGSVVRRGQRIAVVANQHVSAPHVHEDLRNR